MPNFTIYFSDYLKDHEVPSVLDKMPEDSNGKSFKQRFIDRNYYKEIGSETEELFTMHLAIRCDECIEDYLWKIQLFNDNYQKLMNRYIDVHNEFDTQNDGEDKSNSEVKNYLNPLDDQSDVLDSKGKQDNSYEYGKHTHRTEDRQHAVSWARSNPEIMKASLELEDIYTKALESLDNLFMEIL